VRRAEGYRDLLLGGAGAGAGGAGGAGAGERETVGRVYVKGETKGKVISTYGRDYITVTLPPVNHRITLYRLKGVTKGKVISTYGPNFHPRGPHLPAR
jgi:hypothetical protein